MHTAENGDQERKYIEMIKSVVRPVDYTNRDRYVIYLACAFAAGAFAFALLILILVIEHYGG